MYQLNLFFLNIKWWFFMKKYRSLERKINELKVDMPEVEEELVDIPEGLIPVLSACLDVYASGKYYPDGFDFRAEGASNHYVKSFFNHLLNPEESDPDPLMLGYIYEVSSELSEEGKEIFLNYVDSVMKDIKESRE